MYNARLTMITDGQAMQKSIKCVKKVYETKLNAEEKCNSRCLMSTEGIPNLDDYFQTRVSDSGLGFATLKS